MGSQTTDMRKLWQGIGKTLFWSYERGTWPYDVMVLGVVLFVFLTPRTWFNDQPNVTLGQASVHVQVVGEDSTSGTRTYRINARALTPPTPDPGFVRKTQEFLGKNVDELKGSTFQIKEILPARDSDGTVLYYDVKVKR